MTTFNEGDRVEWIGLEQRTGQQNVRQDGIVRYLLDKDQIGVWDMVGYTHVLDLKDVRLVEPVADAISRIQRLARLDVSATAKAAAERNRARRKDLDLLPPAILLVLIISIIGFTLGYMSVVYRAWGCQ